MEQEELIPDLFISYSKKDEEKADILTALLTKEGWEVWKDNRINAGRQFEVEILKAINNARAVLVLWSTNSVQSSWVIKEATIALEQNKLKPVLLEACQIPESFATVEAALLTTWQGEKEHRELSVLYNGITDSVIPSRLDNVRKGFDPFFLDKKFKIMLPEVRGAADLIHYANFSVVMNPVRRMAWYVAYNIDGKAYQAGTERNDHWMPDPLWPQSLQPSNNHFINSGWHRGHLLSPQTVSWGNKRIAGIAKRQANYWTNTTPQSSKMNVKWWYALEQFERQLSKERKKAVGLSGPVFSEDDQSFRDEFEKDNMFIARETYRIPKAYWKLIITKNKRSLEYCCFILDQFHLEEETKKRPFRLTDYLMSIQALEDKTGLKFSPLLHQLKMVNKEITDQFDTIRVTNLK